MSSFVGEGLFLVILKNLSSCWVDGRAEAGPSDSIATKQYLIPTASSASKAGMRSPHQKRRYFSKGNPSRSTNSSKALKPSLLASAQAWSSASLPTLASSGSGEVGIFISSHPGAIISSGRTIASKSSPLMPSAMASSRKVVPFLWAVLATLAARS